MNAFQWMEIMRGLVNEWYCSYLSQDYWFIISAPHEYEWIRKTNREEMLK